MMDACTAERALSGLRFRILLSRSEKNNTYVDKISRSIIGENELNSSVMLFAGALLILECNEMMSTN